LGLAPAVARVPRVPTLAPSLLGLPLRLVWAPSVALLAVSLLTLALERTHVVALVVERFADADCVPPVPCMMHPVAVMTFAERLDAVVAAGVARREVPVWLLLVVGADFVLVWLSDVCGYVWAETTASDSMAAAHVLAAIHFFICIPP
jgi:hypothetical protein